MSPIEKVARAMFEANCASWGALTFEELKEALPEIHRMYLRYAHAAIEALREPSEEMVEAAYQAVERDDCWNIEDGQHFAKAWRAACDAISEEASDG